MDSTKVDKPAVAPPQPPDSPAKPTSMASSGSTASSGAASSTTPPVVSPPVSPPIQRRSTPPSPGDSDKPALWLLLLLCLALALPLLLVELHRPDVTQPAEARALVQARELYEHVRQTPTAHWWHLENWVPIYNGQLDYTAHPGLSWAYTLGLSIHDQFIHPVDTERLILIGRWTSAFFMLMTLLGVFWAGRCIGGNYSAVFAGLICLSTPSVIWFARQATADIVHTGLMSLAIASSLWAIRPLKPSPSIWRQALGWGLCGTFLAGALLVVGPIAWLTVGLPVLMMIVLCPGRIGHVLGWVAALLTGFVLVLPWTLFVYDRQPMAWLLWIEPLAPDFWKDPLAFTLQWGQRLGWVFVLLLPWTLWLLGGLGQPFSPSSKGARIRLFLGWVWFAPLTLLLVMLPQADHAGFLLPLIPAAAVLIGQTFTQFVELAAQGRYTKTWRRLCWVHLFMLVSASVMIPVLIHTQNPWLARHFTALTWPVTAGFIALLWAILFLGLRTMHRDYPGKTLALWSIWGIVLVFVLSFPHTRAPHSREPLRYAGPPMRELVQGQMIYWLQTGSSQASAFQPDPRLLLYTGLVMPLVRENHLAELLAGQGPMYLLAPPQRVAALPLSAHLRLQLAPMEQNLYFCTHDVSEPHHPPASRSPR